MSVAVCWWVCDCVRDRPVSNSLRQAVSVYVSACDLTLRIPEGDWALSLCIQVHVYDGVEYQVLRKDLGVAIRVCSCPSPPPLPVGFPLTCPPHAGWE